MILCPLLPAFFPSFPQFYETLFLLCLFVTYLFFSLVFSFFFSLFVGAHVVFMIFFPHQAIFIPPLPPGGGGGIFQYIDPWALYYYIELRECTGRYVIMEIPFSVWRWWSLFAVPAEQQAVPQRAGLRKRASSRRCREIQQVGLHHRVPTPSPLSLRVAKVGRNHLNEEIVPFLLNGIGEGYSQTISNLEHAALWRRCELPL